MMAGESGKKRPARGPMVKILVSVDEGHAERMENVASELRSAGMRVAEMFPLSGTIAGETPVKNLVRLNRVAGVAAVEEEPTFHAYP